MENSQNVMVTIRCLAYNHEPYIRQCLEGFVMQKTNFKFEAIVHDDASTDGTAAIILEYAEKYPDIIKPIIETENQYSKQDGSLHRIMNAHMRGKYIALCEGDDYWIDPYKLQKQVDFLEANHDYGLVWSKAKVFDQNKSIFLNKSIGFFCKDDSDLIRNNGIVTLTTMCRKSLFDAYYREVVPQKDWLMGDFPIWLFISLKSKIYFFNEEMGVYRKLINSATGRTSLENREKFIKSSYSVSRFFIEKFGAKFSIDKLLVLEKSSLFFNAVNYNDRNLSYCYIQFIKKISLKYRILNLCCRSIFLFSILRILIRLK